MIQNMIVSRLNPDGTKTELYRSDPSDSEQVIMENVIKTFLDAPDTDIIAATSDNDAIAIDAETETALERHPEPLRCDDCGGLAPWCSICETWTRTCCVDWGTCLCS